MAATLKTRCVRCGHPFSFHGRSTTVACKATGCHADAGKPCPGFVDPDATVLVLPQAAVTASPFAVTFQEPGTLSAVS